MIAFKPVQMILNRLNRETDLVENLPPVRIAWADKIPLSTAGPIPSPRSRVARPAASPIIKALSTCPVVTGCLR